MNKKYFISVLLTVGICLSGMGETNQLVAEWFELFSKSFSEINKEYHISLEQNEQLRKRYNFETQFIDLSKGDKISIPVEGMDYVYLSVERNDRQLRWGSLFNPWLVDESGKKHPLFLTSDNLLFGSISDEKKEGKIEYQFGGCICKVPFNGNFSILEVEYPKQDALLRVDVASDFLVTRNIISKWDELRDSIMWSCQIAKEEDKIIYEVNAGLGKWVTRNSDNNILADFYLDNLEKGFIKKPKDLKPGEVCISELYQLRKLFIESQKLDDAIERIENRPIHPVLMSIKDCIEQFPDKYLKGYEYLEVVENFISEKQELVKQLKSGDLNALIKVNEYFAIIDKALLNNPLLDFDEIVLLKRNVESSRKKMPKQFGFPSLNSHNNTRINEIGGDWNNTISRLTDLRGERKVETIFCAKDKKLITDLELDFDRENILFSMENDSDLWHVYEADINGENLKCVTPDSLPDVNHFDACYLPDGNIVFTSDATYQGLPCEGGSRPMTLLYVIDRKTGKIRQLTYEQDSDFCPTVLNNGRLMYLRWEYSDLAHYFSRILMSCNPDGTGQMEYYGSNSYFPNTYIYARPIPNHPTKTVGIVGGHHGISRSGRLMIIDPAKGRSEADGVVQEIPHRGKKVEPIIKDQLVAGVWPQFIHPYPLSDKYFLVSAKMNENSLWGIYLVDVFDNMTLIKEIEGSGLFDPIPVRKEKTPPVIPSRIKEGEKEATVFISDIYVGDGLKNIPKGTVKELRLFSYHYAHISTGGHQTVGVESSWDIKRVLGTVPVERDGSALFKIPANTPISIQPLDSTGKALQVMRSWFVGMPGENVSCIGCHERTSQVPPNMFRMASRKSPSNIENWHGNPRPFSFRYEVQPVLDKYCVSCHNGVENTIPDFRRHEFVDMEGKQRDEYFFEDKAYMSLHPYVRRPGPESDIHMFNPMEYHASSSELIQLLQRGHHGVDIDPQDFERLYAWIDLNAPYRGKWSPPEFRDFDQDERRKCLNKRYANIEVDPEAEYDSLVAYMEDLVVDPIKVEKKNPVKYEIPNLEGWPFLEKIAKKKQFSLLKPNEQFELGNGQIIKFSGIPSGEFIQGNSSGYFDEQEPKVVEIDKPFFMSECEITNAQYSLFDPTHDSRFIDQQWKDHTTPGYPANRPNQPVIRVSYDEALAFCDWLSKRIGRNVTLPTENQWEWACRAGTSSDFWYNSSSSSFAEYENLADQEIRKFAVTGVNPGFIGDHNSKMDQYAFIPREENIDDGNMIAAPVGSYKPNAWGLYDMHGNVAEWTSTSYQPAGSSQDKYYNASMKVVKGGSWRDRSKISKSSSRRYYLPYQKVYNVGFRVVIE